MRGDTLIIMTGGTIDAEAYPDPLNPPKDAAMLKTSLIPEVVWEMKGGSECDFLSWKAKDSKHFTREDMEDLAKIIRTSHARHIIITHGTDAMAEHSREISALLQRQDHTLRRDKPSGAHDRFIRGEHPATDKVVVFTGALMPLANGSESDAYKNLEYILRNIHRWPPGVRAVMHQTSFHPEGLSKNFITYRFEGREIAEAPREMGRQ
jgi:L-asparaginase